MTKSEIENLREAVQAMESIEKNLRVGLHCLSGEQLTIATTHFNLAASAYDRAKVRFMALIKEGANDAG